MLDGVLIRGPYCVVATLLQGLSYFPTYTWHPNQNGGQPKFQMPVVPRLRYLAILAPELLGPDHGDKRLIRSKIMSFLRLRRWSRSPFIFHPLRGKKAIPKSFLEEHSNEQGERVIFDRQGQCYHKHPALNVIESLLVYPNTLLQPLNPERRMQWRDSRFGERARKFQMDTPTPSLDGPGPKLASVGSLAKFEPVNSYADPVWNL